MHSQNTKESDIFLFLFEEFSKQVILVFSQSMAYVVQFFQHFLLLFEVLFESQRFLAKPVSFLFEV